MSTQLAQRPASEIKQVLSQPWVVDWFKQVTPNGMRNTLTYDRIVRVVMSTVMKNPAVLNCSQASIVKSIAELVSLGIEPGGPLQQGYLVPFGRECTAIIGYRGLITLLHRSGAFRSITANTVHQNDYFDCDLASGERPTHKLPMDGIRGDMIYVYCIAEFGDGSRHITVMTRSEVDAVRGFSRSAKSPAWVNHYEEMAKKTVIRRASKLWPLSYDDMRIMAHIDEREESTFVDTNPLSIPTPNELMALDGISEELAEQKQSSTEELLSMIESRS